MRERETGPGESTGRTTRPLVSLRHILLTALVVAFATNYRNCLRGDEKEIPQPGASQSYAVNGKEEDAAGIRVEINLLCKELYFSTSRETYNVTTYQALFDAREKWKKVRADEPSRELSGIAKMCEIPVGTLIYILRGAVEVQDDRLSASILEDHFLMGAYDTLAELSIRDVSVAKAKAKKGAEAYKVNWEKITELSAKYNSQRINEILNANVRKMSLCEGELESYLTIIMRAVFFNKEQFFKYLAGAGNADTLINNYIDPLRTSYTKSPDELKKLKDAEDGIRRSMPK